MVENSVPNSRRPAKPVILHINHSCGGGTEKHVRELCEHLRDQADMLVLRPVEDHRILVEPGAGTFCSHRIFDPAGRYGDLICALRTAGVSRIHVHQLFSLPLDVKRLIDDCGVPFDTTVHDYYGLCPQVHFKTKANRYCGEPDEAHCLTCLGSGPDHGKYQRYWLDSFDYFSACPCPGAPDLSWWRKSHRWVFVDAQRVLCPSKDVARRIARYHPSSRCIVVPHDSIHGSVYPSVWPRPMARDEPLVIGILGGMDRFKGADTVSATALEAGQRGLDLVFHLIGEADDCMPLSPAGPLYATGRYENHEVFHLIERVKPHVIWFPAQVPETFSYTLSEAMKAGLPVVVPNIGSFAERVSGRAWSWVVPWNLPAHELASFFSSMRREHFIPGAAPNVVCNAVHDFEEVCDFYTNEYIDFVADPFPQRL